MRACIARAARYLRARLLMRWVLVAECLSSTPHDEEPETISFAEILAASTVLDFGGLPVESRRSPGRIGD